VKAIGCKTAHVPVSRRNQIGFEFNEGESRISVDGAGYIGRPGPQQLGREIYQRGIYARAGAGNGIGPIRCSFLRIHRASYVPRKCPILGHRGRSERNTSGTLSASLRSSLSSCPQSHSGSLVGNGDIEEHYFSGQPFGRATS